MAVDSSGYGCGSGCNMVVDGFVVVVVVVVVVVDVVVFMAEIVVVVCVSCDRFKPYSRFKSRNKLCFYCSSSMFFL